MEVKSVLSIQSHVVHGYVGNRAAVFPLQLRGWDVDVINTVSLSNNTGYGSWTGTKASAQELSDLYRGLKDRGFAYDAMLTGYTWSAEAVRAIGDIASDLKKRYPHLLWVLDPVLGDGGSLYVSPDVVPAYKELLKSGTASVITPNGFEVETLTGVKLDSLDSIKKALEIFHQEYKIPYVVISSVELPGSSNLVAVGSAMNSEPFYIEFPHIEGYFTGTGDIFSAVLLDRFHKHSAESPSSASASGGQESSWFERALHDTLAVVYSVLLRTKTLAGVPSDRSSLERAELMKKLELRVIQSQDLILQDSPSIENVDFVTKRF